MARNYDVMTFISKYILRRLRVANFADIIKIETIFINLLISGEKMLITAEVKRCVT